MNYPYPIPGSTGTANSFIADNSGVLGSIRKATLQRVVVNVDYSKLVPSITLPFFSFKVTPGQIPITSVALGTPPAGLTFAVDVGGVTGQQETIAIQASVTTPAGYVRLIHVLYVDVYDPNDDGSCCGVSALAGTPSAPIDTSGDGNTFVNTAPRYFISSTPPQGANVMDMWFNTNTGIISVFATDGVNSWWQTIVLPQGQPSGAVIKLTRLIFDGINGTYPLTAIGGAPLYPSSPEDLLISLDGVWQEAEASYTVSSNTITFATAPATDVYFFGLCFGNTV